MYFLMFTRCFWMILHAAGRGRTVTGCTALTFRGPPAAHKALQQPITPCNNLSNFAHSCMHLRAHLLRHHIWRHIRCKAGHDPEAGRTDDRSSHSGCPSDEAPCHICCHPCTSIPWSLEPRRKPHPCLDGGGGRAAAPPHGVAGIDRRVVAALQAPAPEQRAAQRPVGRERALQRAVHVLVHALLVAAAGRLAELLQQQRLAERGVGRDVRVDPRAREARVLREPAARRRAARGRGSSRPRGRRWERRCSTWCGPCTAAGATAPQRELRAGRSGPTWHSRYASVCRRSARRPLRHTQRGAAACRGTAAHLSGHMWKAAKEMSPPECCATKSWPTPPALCARRASGGARTRIAAAHDARLQAGGRDAPAARTPTSRQPL